MVAYATSVISDPADPLPLLISRDPRGFSFCTLALRTRRRGLRLSMSRREQGL